MRRIGLYVGLVIISVLGAGCAAVQPWQRGTMADYTMRPDRDPLADSEYEHVYFTREGAAGGRGVGGGGCGCN
ncbi:MAG: DUF4266 domain-containing protein [Lentisphaerae bacterium]|nr:DUF4266 domain-containing protein [Lentisphaerota bacterium]